MKLTIKGRECEFRLVNVNDERDLKYRVAEEKRKCGFEGMPTLAEIAAFRNSPEGTVFLLNKTCEEKVKPSLVEFGEFAMLRNEVDFKALQSYLQASYGSYDPNSSKERG